MTIGELIRLLSDGEFHSGEQLGERLGVSRTAIWKQLKKLEALDIPFEAVKGQGYRLVTPMELLDGGEIVSGLPRQGRQHLVRLFVEETLPSSNEFIRQRFAQGAGHGEVCLVEQQSAGRGRRGRTWSTPWGGGANDVYWLALRVWGHGHRGAQSGGRGGVVPGVGTLRHECKAQVAE